MNIIIIGRRGLGKSTLAQYEAERLQPNRIYWDPGDQFDNVTLKTSSLDHFTSELEDWDPDKPILIAYVPPRGGVEAHWNVWAARLWEFIGKHDNAASFVLIVDESHRLQSPQKINEMLDEFIRRAPRRERGDRNPIDLIQTTHYPQDLHRVSWGESDKIMFFNVFDKRAIRAIDEQYGEEVAERVQSLTTPKLAAERGEDPRSREVLVIESETGNYYVIRDYMEWYRDIKKVPEAEVPPRLSSSGKDIEAMYGRL